VGKLWLLAVLPVLLGGCWPGRCGGALRGTPRVHFGEDHAPCTRGSVCAEVVSPDVRFRQGGDFARVDDLATLLASSGLDATTWFLVDQYDSVVASRIEPKQHSAAHSCASAIGFELIPEAPLAGGEYRLVLLVERISWPVLRQGTELTLWNGEPAIVQFYQVIPTSMTD
jgi:hypothetical protein